MMAYMSTILIRSTRTGFYFVRAGEWAATPYGAFHCESRRDVDNLRALIPEPTEVA